VARRDVRWMFSRTLHVVKAFKR